MVKKARVKKSAVPAIVDETIFVEPKPIGDADPVRDASLAEDYIKFRIDPINDQFDDSLFCSEPGISDVTLNRIKTIDVLRKISQSQITPDALKGNIDRLMRQVNKRTHEKELPIKSLEGIINAFCSLLKQYQLANDKPTERIAVRGEDLNNKTTQELHDLLMGHFRGSRMN